MSDPTQTTPEAVRAVGVLVEAVGHTAKDVARDLREFRSDLDRQLGERDRELDRRLSLGSDTFAAINARLDTLESTAVTKEELAANTAITQSIYDAIAWMGVVSKPFRIASAWVFRILSKIAAGLHRIWLLVVIAAAVWWYARTGKWPEKWLP